MLKKVKVNNLKKAIKISFEKDYYIFRYTDPNLNLANNEELCESIINKISEFNNDIECNIECFEFYFDNEICGFLSVCTKNNLLISFGLSNRAKYIKNIFFGSIRNVLKDKFECYMWSKNIRAIKWLQKCGMIIEKEFNHDGNKVTKLIFEKCQ